MALPSSLSTAKQFTLSKISGLSKRQKIATACLAVGATGLMLTNPKRDAYLDYYAETVNEKIVENCDKIHPRLDLRAFIFRMPAKDVCEKAASGSLNLVDQAARSQYDKRTKRTSLLLFSIYTTEDIFGSKKTKTLGIARQFISFSRG
ncbi:MAG: DUF4359 domain-containing protein [Cyanobacteria bacterium P01_D01_bin.36]